MFFIEHIVFYEMDKKVGSTYICNFYFHMAIEIESHTYTTLKLSLLILKSMEPKIC